MIKFPNDGKQIKCCILPCKLNTIFHYYLLAAKGANLLSVFVVYARICKQYAVGIFLNEYAAISSEK